MRNLTKKLVCVWMIALMSGGLDVLALDEGNLRRVEENPAVLCQETLVPVFDEALNDYLVFLDEHFKNKSSNSSLSNNAVARFGEYRETINAVFGLVSIRGEGDNEAEFSAYVDCEKLTAEYVAIGRKALMDRVKSSTAQKKTTVMLEKYKSINGRLREMQLEVAQMYGYFMTFNNKLPGFLRKCFSK